MWEGLGKALEKSWKSLGTKMEALEKGKRLEVGDWGIGRNPWYWGQKSVHSRLWPFGCLCFLPLPQTKAKIVSCW
jgi:hypothetical protein